MALSERPRSHDSGRNSSLQDNAQAHLPSILVSTATDQTPSSAKAGEAQVPHVDKKDGNGHTVIETASSSASHNAKTDAGPGVVPTATKRKEIALAWIPACLTVIMLVLTALYALRPGLWKSDFINSSPSNAIFVLRALSEVTGFLLAITVASAFELLQWLLTVREGGIPLAEFLCLQQGTGILGLIQITAGPNFRVGTRFWGALRLLAVASLPILGVLIMSEVGTVLRFDKVGQTVAPLGFGLGSLNTSVAVTLSPFTDILLGASFSQFLDDPTHAVDISDVDRRRACSPSVTEEIAAQITTDAHPRADTWLVEDHQGYVLRFTEGDQKWVFETGTECRTYYTEAVGSTLGAFRLCAKNVGPSQIEARISSCSYADTLTGSCGKESTWNSTPAWTTRLSSTFRQAKIAYSRLNGTIISHEFSTLPETVAPLQSADLLGAWDNFLGLANSTDLTTSTTLEILGLGAGKFMFPAMIASMLNSITELSPHSPALQTRAVNALQALLAIPVYFCQTGYIERQAVSELPSNILLTNYDNINLPAGLKRNSPVYFTVSRNQIVVGLASVIAYVILSGFVLILCFLALGGGVLTKRFSHVPDTTSFPLLDFCRHCVVTTKNGVPTTNGTLQSTERYDDIAIREMDVKMAKKTAYSSAYEKPPA
ncbi:hypothetical protein AYO20_05899 [Fonsecaea nubica]|uniref:Uncharacterized protein n=1 Tax=Fonsecaea nubica TaxID=856822 RepID=A0A178CYP8_9EURO|nr:hypothetical protein AYO20_05899 [Fonsecaea nubica]OAL34938.1 hypothetical protein AYO20_05899 [Fonsecaea nubica]